MSLLLGMSEEAARCGYRCGASLADVDSECDDALTSEHISRCTSPQAETLSTSTLSLTPTRKYVPPSLRSSSSPATTPQPASSESVDSSSTDSSVALSAPTSPVTLHFDVARALANGTARMQAIDEDCVGGTYFMKDGSATLAVGKPSNEEAGGKFNPKGYASEGDCSKLGFTPGEGYKREAFAYAIGGDFANVPETVVMELPSSLLEGAAGGRRRRPKMVKASLQRFIAGAAQSWDSGPAAYHTEDVHRIGVLDLRLLNCDRHGGNILAKKDEMGRARLFPIDHGYTMPTCLADLDFEWQLWPQSKKPFSDEVVDFVRNIDVEADAKLAEDHGIEADAVALFKAATVVLKVGVELGLTLSELAAFFRRERLNEESGLELLYSACRNTLDDSPEAALINFPELESRAREVLAGDWRALLK